MWVASLRMVHSAQLGGGQRVVYPRILISKERVCLHLSIPSGLFHPVHKIIRNRTEVILLLSTKREEFKQSGYLNCKNKGVCFSSHIITFTNLENVLSGPKCTVIKCRRTKWCACIYERMLWQVVHSNSWLGNVSFNETTVYVSAAANVMTGKEFSITRRHSLNYSWPSQMLQLPWKPVNLMNFFSPPLTRLLIVFIFRLQFLQD